MKNLMVFEGKKVEVFEWNSKVLFNPKHVAECLEIKDVNSSIRKFNERQVIKLKNSDMHDMHIRKLNNAGENFLTESGVYKLIFQSHKEEAERFQDWVTDEVLPAIRNNGGYIANHATPQQVTALVNKYASKYCTDRIHDRKSVRKYIREANPMTLKDIIEEVKTVTEPMKAEIKRDILTVAIKEIDKINDGIQYDNPENTYVKTVCEIGARELTDILLGKAKRRINTLERKIS